MLHTGAIGLHWSDGSTSKAEAPPTAPRRGPRVPAKPYHWSQADWVKELGQVRDFAAWQAGCEFDPRRGIDRDTFIRRRIKARVLTRARQEWAWADRFVPEIAEANDDADEPETHGHSPAPRSTESAEENPRVLAVSEVLDKLPLKHRELMDQLYWKRMTQQEVVDASHTSRSKVVRDKERVFKTFREELKKYEKIFPPTGQKVGLPAI